jgi:hypothetical protein
MTDHEITEAMLRFGGSFVQHLGQLWRAGDEINRRALKAAFPAYWAQYRDLAERWAAEHPTVTR